MILILKINYKMLRDILKINSINHTYTKITKGFKSISGIMQEYNEFKINESFI
jgi:hypothetical protein